jgi:hypothetical protein
MEERSYIRSFFYYLLMLRTLRSRYVAVLAKFSLLAHILRSKSGCFMVTA